MLEIVDQTTNGWMVFQVHAATPLGFALHSAAGQTDDQLTQLAWSYDGYCASPLKLHADSLALSQAVDPLRLDR